MAKKPITPTQPGPKATRSADISKLISHAEITAPTTPIYSNHVQITSSTTELIIDLFRIEPTPLDAGTTLKASYLQRVIIPLAKAKSLASAIALSVSSLEDAIKEMENNQSLPTTETASE
jgi:hypothetical protein